MALGPGARPGEEKTRRRWGGGDGVGEGLVIPVLSYVRGGFVEGGDHLLCVGPKAKPRTSGWKLQGDSLTERAPSLPETPLPLEDGSTSSREAVELVSSGSYLGMTG